MTNTIPHVLPDETGGDTSWFRRLNDFERQETCRQVRFKNHHWPGLPNGRFSKQPQHTYPHILPASDPPDENLKKAFYPPLADAILDYMRESKIAPHSELLNLRSSQAACFNFLFPMRQDRALAAQVLRQFFPTLQQVKRIEFEYTGAEEYPGDNGIVDWLGEPHSGKRGQNRTSIDAAIFWQDNAGREHAGQEHAALVEWKYTERGYGVCSAFSRASALEKAACLGLDVSQKPAPHQPTPEQVCLLCSGVRHRQRRYWEHMAGAGIDLRAFREVAGCPFQGPFYQLMRQSLVVAYLRGKGIRAQLVSLGFAGNSSLSRLPEQLRPLSAQSVVDAWNGILMEGTPPLLHLTAEELMAAVEKTGGFDLHWRGYIRERYAV